MTAFHSIADLPSNHLQCRISPAPLHAGPAVPGPLFDVVHPYIEPRNNLSRSRNFMSETAGKV